MASPFRVFRKHQKAMIAFFGLAAMVAFVFLSGPVLDSLMSRSATDDVVVKTTQYGSLRASELDSLMRQRSKVLGFLQQVRLAVLRAEGTGETLRNVEGAIGPASKEAVVDTWLVAQHAEKLGLVVSNQAVRKFIEEVTENLVHASELKLILKKVGLRSRHLFELLRHELLAMNLRRMFQASLGGATPGQRWDYYNRLNRMAKIEAAPVSVARYADAIEDPGDAVLQEFFDKYKDRYSDPTSPEPGFRSRYKIAARYFKADPEKFIASGAITEDEVRKRYEQNEYYYDRLHPDADEPDAAEPNAEQPAAEEKPGADAPPPDDQEGNADGQPGDVPQEGEGPSEEDAKSVDSAERSPTEDEESTEEKPAAEQEESAAEQEEPAAEQEESTESKEESAEDAPDEESEDVTDEPTSESADSDDASSSIRPASPFILTSLLQESATEEPATEESAAEEEPSGAESGEPADDSQPADDSAEAVEGPVEEPQEPSAPAPKKPVEDEGDAPEKPPQSERPKDILAGPIGDTIRRELANERISEIFDVLKTKLKKFNDDRHLYDADPSNPKPTELDCDSLAEQYGLTTRKTKLITQLEVADEDVGRSYVDMSIPFASYAFEESWILYVPANSMDLDGNRYLVWKENEAEEKVPSFTDPGIRQKVLTTWRMIEARSKAQQEAQRLADLARASGKTLQQTLAEESDVAVVTTDAFSWMTYGKVPMGSSRTPPRLSQVEGIDTPGPEFMRTVLDLKVGEIGVAMNHPETIAYVIRVTEVNPDEDSLQTGFQFDRYGTYMPVGQMEQYQTMRAWQEELRSTAGLEWLVSPTENR